ncbi:MAG: hypothetical protein M1823_005998 [Watsoniomyces obsoletus]|nr:MAG: hypothetical protein M1823_005998 [Watsoniomyces obsoletus]
MHLPWHVLLYLACSTLLHAAPLDREDETQQQQQFSLSDSQHEVHQTGLFTIQKRAVGIGGIPFLGKAINKLDRIIWANKEKAESTKDMLNLQSRSEAELADICRELVRNAEDFDAAAEWPEDWAIEKCSNRANAIYIIMGYNKQLRRKRREMAEEIAARRSPRVQEQLGTGDQARADQKGRRTKKNRQEGGITQGRQEERRARRIDPNKMVADVADSVSNAKWAALAAHAAQVVKQPAFKSPAKVPMFI